MSGKRGRAFEDLRTPSGSSTPGMKPGVLQMLFAGGSADKAKATQDLRFGHYPPSMKPATGKMLFRGGPADAVATDDERMGHGDEDENLPHNMKMLSDGGEAGDGFSATSEEKLAAHEAMHAMKSGDAMGFLKAMKGLFMLMESGEGPEQDDGE